MALIQNEAPEAGWFWLSAIDAAGNESLETVPFYVQPNDTASPSDTSSFNASQAASNTYVELDWEAVLEDDVQGYDLSRKLPSESVFTALSGPAPIRDVAYVDGNLTQGGQYEYKLTTRDTAGNSSGGVTVTVQVSLGGGGNCLPGFPCNNAGLEEGARAGPEKGWRIAWDIAPGGWADLEAEASGGYWSRMSERPELLPELAVFDLITVLSAMHRGSVRLSCSSNGRAGRCLVGLHRSRLATPGALTGPPVQSSGFLSRRTSERFSGRRKRSGVLIPSHSGVFERPPQKC